MVTHRIDLGMNRLFFCMLFPWFWRKTSTEKPTKSERMSLKFFGWDYLIPRNHLKSLCLWPGVEIGRRRLRTPWPLAHHPLKGLKSTLLKSQCSPNEVEKPQLYTKWVKERKISLYNFQGEYHFQSQLFASVLAQALSDSLGSHGL